MAKKKGKKSAAKKRSSARKAPAKRKMAKVSKKRSGAKRKPNPAFMMPMMPDPALAAIVGAMAQARTEITKKIWAYIKKNRLQDEINRRMINDDEKLREIFGGRRQVSMFEMTKMVNEHLRK